MAHLVTSVSSDCGEPTHSHVEALRAQCSGSVPSSQSAPAFRSSHCRICPRRVAPTCSARASVVALVSGLETLAPAGGTTVREGLPRPPGYAGRSGTRGWRSATHNGHQTCAGSPCGASEPCGGREGVGVECPPFPEPLGLIRTWTTRPHGPTRRCPRARPCRVGSTSWVGRWGGCPRPCRGACTPPTARGG